MDFDPFTGKHLVVSRRGIDETNGDIVVSWLGPLHFGTFGRAKVLSMILGLVPPLLLVTGSLMD
jgi:hypothetical protein